MPKVSVIVPVYNVERFLPRCLDSVLKQTEADFEVICVNDGSQDSCSEILSRYARQDNRIKVLTQENQGLSMARNNGLLMACGEYVLFVDSDDCIHPQLLETTLYFAEKYAADMVSFSFAKISKSEVVLADKTVDVSQIRHKLTETPLYFYAKKQGRWKVGPNAWSKLYRRSLIKDIAFIAGIYNEDYPHTVEVLSKEPRTVLLKEKLYCYTCNEASISHQKITPKCIADYHTGLSHLYDVYQNGSKKNLTYLIKVVFSNIFKQELNRILSDKSEDKSDLWVSFQKQLVDLNKKGCVRLSGNKLSRWLVYNYLIKTGNARETKAGGTGK